jgi:GT2 family glycosyltransferase
MDASGVAAVVLHFRDADQTLRCIRSLQSERIGRLILVDNSEDGGRSLEVISSKLPKLRRDGLAVDVISPHRNLGFARGVNTALPLAASAAAVLIINSDAQLRRGALMAMARRLSQTAVVIPTVVHGKSGASSSLIGFYHKALGLVLKNRRGRCQRYPSGCCLLLRSDVAKRPLFDEDFFFYCEDVMLGHDLDSRGLQVGECLEAEVVHAGSRSAVNGSMFYEYHINRGHWLLARKLARSSFQRVMYSGGRLISLPTRALIRSCRLQSTTPWRGWMAATFDVINGRCRSFTPPP